MIDYEMFDDVKMKTKHYWLFGNVTVSQFFLFLSVQLMKWYKTNIQLEEVMYLPFLGNLVHLSWNRREI